jgi:hypothetical protein
VKAGPAVLPVRSDGYNGQLDIRATSTAPGTWDRRYFAQAFGFPAVQGTATCPSGTYTRWFGPRTSILSTSAGVLNVRTVPPDGILAGTETRSDTAGLTATWNWHLEPER